MSLGDWTIKDYKKQWREAIKRLGDHDISCFISSAANMSKSPFVWVYTLYKEENTVFIRERLLDSDTIAETDCRLPHTALNAQNCYDFIEPRDPAEEVWEKSVALADVESFKVI